MKNKSIEALGLYEALEACKKGFPKAFENISPIEWEITREESSVVRYISILSKKSIYSFNVAIDYGFTPMFEAYALFSEETIKDFDYGAATDFLRSLGYKI